MLWLLACTQKESGSLESETFEEIPPPEPFAFTDISLEWGLFDTDDGVTIAHDEGVIAAADFDGDGDDEILLANLEQGIWYHKNEGDHFELNQVSTLLNVSMLAVGDIDNDGDLDWIAAGETLAIELWVNDGSGNFENRSEGSGLQSEKSVTRHHGAFGDYDNDGDLDLYITMAGGTKYPDETTRNQLFANDGTGVFTDVSASIKSGALQGLGWSSVWFDLDNDGDLDLYTANGEQDCFGPSVLLRNDGKGESDWNFSPLPADCYCAEIGPTMGVSAGDFNRDGWFDLFVSATGPAHLLQNFGDGTFFNATSAWDAFAVENEREMMFGSVIQDLDLDGYPDIWAVTGPLIAGGVPDQPQDQPDAFMAGGPDHFTNKTEEYGVIDNAPGRAVVPLALNTDIIPEVVVGNLFGPSHLYQSYGGYQRGLVLDLVGTRSNRFGVGTRIEVKTDQGSLWTEVRAEAGWGSTMHPRAWIGLGADRVERITLYWPSGTIQKLDPAEIPESGRTQVIEPE